MPILSSKSPLKSFNASRIFSAAAIARSGVGNVAITASPIVFTTAPLCAPTISFKDPKVSAHQIVGSQISNSFVKFRRPLEVGKQKGETGNFEPLIHVQRIGTINITEGLIG